MRPNPEQEKAARALKGPVVITAGAGSGKTRVLTERFVNAIRSGMGDGEPVGVDEVVAITFTEKAAGELTERVRSGLREAGATEVLRRLDTAWISTIHGLCARLLRQHALEMGLDPSFAVADTVAAAQLRERAFEEAAAAVLEGGSGDRLLGRYRLEAISAAVVGLTDELRRQGLPPSALLPEKTRPAREILHEALVLFGDTLAGLRACGDAGKTVAKHADACASAVERLRELSGVELDDADLAEAVWRELERYGAGKASTRASGELVQALRTGRERLAREAAAAAAAPSLLGMLALVADFSARYASAKRAASMLDFEDLQLEATRLLADEDLAERVRSRFRLMMVDEFQDTDSLQLALVERLAPAGLCTVGDARQSIYGFRGADLDVYVRHLQEMGERGAEPIILNRNYRSHPHVLAFVNAVFAAEEFFGNEGFVRLRAEREEPDPPLLARGEPRVELALAHKDGLSEGGSRAAVATHVADRLARLRDESGVGAGDMVVLLRNYTHANAYVDALRARGFAAVIVGGRRFFGLPETQMLLALCRVIANPSDDEAVGLVLASDLASLSDDGLWAIGRKASEDAGVGLWEAGSAVDLSERDRLAIERLRTAVQRGRDGVGLVPLSTLILAAVEDLDLDLQLLAAGDEGREAYANVLKLVRLADAYEASGGAGPAGFVAYLEAKERYGEHETPATLTDDRSPAVRIMSIHASKGLEFPVVAVPEVDCLQRGDSSICRFKTKGDRVHVALKLPSEWRARPEALDRTPLYEELRLDADEREFEESKRLLYVAATRAREFLLLGGWRNLDKPDERETLFGRLSRRVGIGGLQEVGERTVEIRDGEERLSVGVAVLPSQAPGSEADGPPEEPAQAGSAVDTASEEATELQGTDRSSAVRPSPSQPATPSPVGRGTASLLAVAPPPRLSYSGFAEYERCGLRFLARSVLRVGELPGGGGAGAIGFGSAVHAALQLADGPGSSDQARLAALARYHQLEDASATRLRDVVDRYLSSPLAVRVASMPHRRREMPFMLRVGEGEAGFLLDGAMDVYAVDGPIALIVDYKTGRSGAGEDLAERYRLQSRCYALAAMKDGRRQVEVVFVRPEVVEPAGGLQQVSYSYTAEDAAGIEAGLLGLYGRMTAGEYEPLEVWDDQLCSDCPIALGACPTRPDTGGGDG